MLFTQRTKKTGRYIVASRNIMKPNKPLSDSFSDDYNWIERIFDLAIKFPTNSRIERWPLNVVLTQGLESNRKNWRVCVWERERERKSWSMVLRLNYNSVSIDEQRCGVTFYKIVDNYVLYMHVSNAHDCAKRIPKPPKNDWFDIRNHIRVQY